MNGTCGGHPFKLGKGGARVCDALAMEVDMASATFALRDWTVTVAGNHVTIASRARNTGSTSPSDVAPSGRPPRLTAW